MDKLTTSQVAERLKLGQSTVNLWCRRGRFPNAERVETPQGGYWLIPESDLDNFEPPKMGRPSNKAGGVDGKVTLKASKKGGKK